MALLVTFLLSKYFLVIINWDVDLIRCRILIAARSLPENFFFSFSFFYFNIFFFVVVELVIDDNSLTRVVIVGKFI